MFGSTVWRRSVALFLGLHPALFAAYRRQLRYRPNFGLCSGMIHKAVTDSVTVDLSIEIELHRSGNTEEKATHSSSGSPQTPRLSIDGSPTIASQPESIVGPIRTKIQQQWPTDKYSSGAVSVSCPPHILSNHQFMPQT